MYLFFDTETTGLPADFKAPPSDTDNWPRLVQLGFLVYDQHGDEVNQGNLIVRPEGFTIPQNASDIHGITTEKALEKGVPLMFVLGAFWSNMIRCEYIIGHNYIYDRNIMGAEYLRMCGKDPFEKKTGICTKTSSTKFCAIPNKYGYKWPTLMELHEKLFNVGFEGAHDAMADIRATAKCFWELEKRGVIDLNPIRGYSA